MLLGESVFSSISAASSLEEPVLAVPSVVKEEDPLEDLFRTTFGEQVEPHSLQVHGSVMDSVFESPHDAPMFQDTEMPTWEPLFQDTQDAPINEASDAELLALLDEVSPSDETVSEKAITAPVAPVAPAVAPAIAASPAPLKNSSSTSSPADSASPASPASKKVKLDKFGCIAYTRKQRNSPLPPVVAEGHDVASVKRARNTEAARRSRARKMKRMMQLEDKCENLVRENEELKAEIEALKRRLA
ncbi:DEKNAAC105403 [Brettanomyces naardenensis]|uniref:DEKNAAC105403 n=1 Tax=Brettanomyces naardenensis TaxID=13370 RepID=A0A448YTC7_BRENA|nr:DEKNAAC105403 [Brettanomyces naardenensis]